jgi:ATP:corrinoid adenosyltransferase
MEKMMSMADTRNVIVEKAFITFLIYIYFNKGDWNEEPVAVKQGRFGYYVRCGKTIAGLRKLDPSTLTLEEAIEILQTRGKLVGSKKKKNGKKSVAKVKEPKAAGKKNGYQIYVSEVMKNGMKMGEAASAWKAMDAAHQQTYKDIALTLKVEDVGTGKKGKRTADSAGVKRPASGYQIYVAEVMKGGMKMGEAASAWKAMDAAHQQTYKDKVIVDSGMKAAAETSKRPASGYQLYVSEVMKSGMKMGEAAAAWKAMDAAHQQTYKDKVIVDSGKKTVSETTKRPASGYQIYVSEVMKSGMKMGEAAAAWKIMDAAHQQTYKDKVIIDSSSSTNVDGKEAVAQTTKRPASGYQLYVSEVMKGGMKMGEAAAAWKAMDAASQDIYRNKMKNSLVS